MTPQRRTIRLTDHQFRYLTQRLPGIVDEFATSVNAGERSLTLDEQELVRLVDSIGDKLLTSGFNSEYELTEEGAMLEGIIESLTSDATPQ